MADVAEKNGTADNDWEYEEEDAEDYAWEYETESEDEVVDKEIERRNSKESAASKEEEDIPLDEQDLPDPFSATPLETTTKVKKPEKTSSSNGDKKKDRHGAEGERRHHHKKHKKSRHLERIEAFSKKETNGDTEVKKRIHVRSKDPSRIARQLEKSLNGGKQSKSSKSRGGAPPPPQQKVNQICKICGKEPYVVERIVAEKSWWHKNCFKCKQCNKSLNLDTYMSHEGVIYCKPHHKELFQPKAVRNDLLNAIDPNLSSGAAAHQKREQMEAAIAKHREQERRHETIIRENVPVQLDDVVKSSTTAEETKYTGLENLDVGSKFKMFERGGAGGSDESLERAMPSSDRYGIMEKLKRLQEGEDLDELLAEIDEELPSASEDEDPDEVGLTEVQKKTLKAEKLFTEGGQDRRDKMAESRRKELKGLREKLMAGNRDSVLDQFGDVLNSSANKIKKTKIDVRSENAKKFRDLFDKGEVPEGGGGVSGKILQEKEQELENMRKARKEKKDFFNKLEAGEIGVDSQDKKEPKLLVGRISKENGSGAGAEEEEMPEMTSLSNRFSFFEHFEEKEEEKKRKKKCFRMTPPPDGEEEEGDQADRLGGCSLLTETDLARKECKARSVLNKFKEMETKVINGEEDVVPKYEDPEKPTIGVLGFLGKLPGVGDRRPMKRFTPPRKLAHESGSDYSGSDYSDSEDYSDSSSYTSSYSGSDSDSEEDETLKAIRATARAKALRAKFEEWEKTKDAKDQMRQMMLTDENGSSLETASHLKAKFEALKMLDEDEEGGDGGENGAGASAGATQKRFRPKRFK